MAKQQAAAVDWDAAVTKTLLTIALADGPMRFVPAGKGGGHPHVFAKNDKEAKKVVELCTAEGNPLAVKVGSAKTEAVELTAAGVLRVLADLPQEKAETLVGVAAKGQPLEDRIVFFKQVAEKVPLPDSMLHDYLTKPIEDKKRADEEAKQAELRRIEREKLSRQTQDKLVEVFRQYAAAVDAERARKREVLEAELRAYGGTPAEPAPNMQTTGEPALPKLPLPTNDDEKDFRRIYVRQLVARWSQSVKQGDKGGERVLETALHNIDGVQPIGKPGEPVPFDPKLHDKEVGVPPGTPVTVRFVGWRLQEQPKDYIVIRAIVE